MGRFPSTGVPTRSMDCVVIGAGPAGLAVSGALTLRGVDHVVLERFRVGQSWRTQRWDSLRLNNPGWMNPMLGEQCPDTYLSAREVVTRLERLAADCPVREQTPVMRLAPSQDEWTVRTHDAEIHARTVVVATGGENRPRIPALARMLPEQISQFHAAEYRNPGQLPSGAVLVVGSAQSGYQITEELLATGRRVFLATSRVGRAPARHRGRDTVEWLVECGFFDQRPQDLPDASIVRAPQPLLAPGGRSASLQTLHRAGAVLTGRVIHIVGDSITFDSGAAANVTAADAYAERIRAVLDDVIGRVGAVVPPADFDPADLPIALDPPVTLNLGTQDIGSVVWCTGYDGDFSWLAPGLTDADGRPVHRGAAGPVPGLWFVGLRWLTRRSSGNFLGFPKDAETVADAVINRLAGRAPVVPHAGAGHRPGKEYR